MFRRIAVAALALAAAISPAFAHLNPGEHGSFLAGFSHPLLGLDHVLVMVAVGLWAAMLSGRPLWIVPVAFVGTMIAGFGLALAGIQLPLVEPMILASAVTIGLMVALAVRLPVAATAGIVGAFALFHGHAHGGEIGVAAAGTYLLGFATATALLHGIGIALVTSAHTRLRTGIVRIVGRTLGGTTALLGIGLSLGFI